MKQTFISTYNDGIFKLALKKIEDTYLVADGEMTWDFDNLPDALNKYEALININYLND